MTPYDILPRIRTGEMTATAESRVKVGRWIVFVEQSVVSLFFLLKPLRHSFTASHGRCRHIDAVLL
jgi:hypothetical protein